MRLHNVIAGIRNLIYWFPVIWHDRNHDHNYILIILRHKLRSISEWQNELEIENESRNVRVSVMLLNRLLDNDYFHNALLGHERMWGKSDLKLVEMPDSCCISLNRVYERPLTETEEKRAKNDLRKWLKHAYYMQQQDLNCLCDTMKKHLLKWWC